MNPQLANLHETTSEIELVRLSKAGNTGAFAELSVRYEPVLRGRAGRYSNVVGVDIQDFVQEGMLALFRAVKGFDEASGISFRTYAVTCINNSMSTAIKSHMKSLGQNAGLSIGGLDEQGCLEDSPVQGLNPVEEDFLQKEADTLRERRIALVLSPFERHVLALYLDGFQYRQISQKLSTTEKSVDNALQRVRRKLRPEL